MRARLRELSTSVAIYGAGDVAVQIVGFLLLPVYVRYLTTEDYGALGLLIGVEAVSKIVSRWGLDGAFMRYYLDPPEAEARRRLASSILVFQAAASGLLVGTALLWSRTLAGHLFGAPLVETYLPALRLVLVNTFLVSFTFVPFHMMRMEKRALGFSALTFARSSSTLLLRLLLVVGAGFGVTGLALADLVVTAMLLPVLWRIGRPLLGPVVSWPVLRRSLRFGLPRLPHGLAQQALDAGNTYLLSLFLPLSALGVYHIGATIARGLKLFLSAFETGWAPFYYHTAREPEAKIVFSKIATYGVAVLALLVAGVAVLANDLVRILTTAAYADAGRVIPLIALGVGLQGIYLLTSIGLNLTGRTEFYPVSTILAAAVGLGSGLLLMPAYGATGAAVSFVLAYLTLALVAFVFAERVYPVQYETGRLARVAGSATLAVVIARLPALSGMPWIDGAVRGLLTVAVFVAVLALTGFFRKTEWRIVREALSRMKRPSRATGTRSG